jgi:hypothetical protein
MASTISDASMTVTITESLILNGVNQGSTKKMTIAGINEVSKRIVRVLASSDSTQIYKGHLNTASYGQFIYGDVKYIRITNLDKDNAVVIHIEDSTLSHDAQFLIPAGHVFFLTDAAASYGSAADIAIPVGNIERIDAMGSGGAVDIEIFVASS